MNFVTILQYLGNVLILVLNIVHMAEGAHCLLDVDLILEDQKVVNWYSSMIRILNDPIVYIPDLQSQLKVNVTLIENR